MPKGPTLYRLAADRQYDRIPEHIRRHPDDLQWSDRYGSTALHILCQARVVDRRLLAAVDAILAMAPEQVAWANIATWTPLHFAVEKRADGDDESTALILRLIRACPMAVSVATQTGFKTKTPFHIACEADADIKVLRAMLEINPSLAVEPFLKRDLYAVAENPVQLLWKNARLNGTRLRRLREKMALLLRAAHQGCLNGDDFCLLHAACSVRCPRDYFALVLEENRAQIAQPDAAGLYPLHYAVKNATADSQAYTQFVIESLLEVYPQAAEVEDTHGRLPLHVAVADTCSTWHKSGVRELTFANPNALRAIDPANGLVPFLTAAVSANKSRLHLSTVYELLLAAPEMVHPRKRPVVTRPPTPSFLIDESQAFVQGEREE